MIHRNLKRKIHPQSDNLELYIQNGSSPNLFSNNIEKTLYKNNNLKKAPVTMYPIKTINKRLKDILKNRITLSSLLKNSSVYILNRISKSKASLQKIFWYLILMFGIVGFFSQIVQFLSSYYSYPVVINIHSHTSKVQIFPAVTICNVNSIKREFEPCLFKKLKNNQCSSVNDTNEFDTENKNKPECDLDLLNILHNISLNSDLVSKFVFLFQSMSFDRKVKYGHRYKDFVENCVYNLDKCTSEDFKLSTSYPFGNCYTFNMGREKKLATTSKPIDGLRLELNLEAEKYAKFTAAIGAKVQVHDPDVPHSINSKGIFISPGYETYIAVTKSIFSRLPSPYEDNCNRYSLGDSQRSCLESCYNNCTKSLCFCSTGIKYENSSQACNLTDLRVWCCLYICQTYEDSCNCPLSCKENKYDLQISTMAWPSKTHFKEIRNRYIKNNDSKKLTYEKFRETRLKLTIYYETLDYIEYKQSPMYHTSQIFSEVGGQMGLWLGLSLVFVFECLENIFLFCRNIFFNICLKHGS